MKFYRFEAVSPYAYFSQSNLVFSEEEDNNYIDKYAEYKPSPEELKEIRKAKRRAAAARWWQTYGDAVKLGALGVGGAVLGGVALHGIGKGVGGLGKMIQQHVDNVNARKDQKAAYEHEEKMAKINNSKNAKKYQASAATQARKDYESKEKQKRKNDEHNQDEARKNDKHKADMKKKEIDNQKRQYDADKKKEGYSWGQSSNMKRKQKTDQDLERNAAAFAKEKAEGELKDYYKKS